MRSYMKIGAADKFLRGTRAQGITVYGIDIESQASRQASRLAASRVSGGAQRDGVRCGTANTPTVGMPTAMAGEGGVRGTVDPGRRGDAESRGNQV